MSFTQSSHTTQRNIINGRVNIIFLLIKSVNKTYCKKNVTVLILYN